MSVVTSSLLPDPPKRGEPEFELQRDVCQFLRWALPANAEFFSIPNGGLRHSDVQAKLIATGLKSGLPDLCVLHRGSAIFIELKAKRGALSPIQKQMHQKLWACGVAVVVCRSVPCVEESLRELGVPLRGKLT